MLESNYHIINRKPFRFSELKVKDSSAVFVCEDGTVETNGVLLLDNCIYAALYCDDVCNITLVSDREGVQTVDTILWTTKEAYLEEKKLLEEAVSVELSRQNKKLNRYAEEIAAKLAIGVRLRVTDVPEENAMVKCPDCGMLSPKGTPYCMDCGAEL